MGSPDACCIIERIPRLAGRAMTGEVEFGDIVREFETLKIKIGVVLSKTFEVVDRPLAGDIIRDDNVFDRYVFQDRGENVVRIDVAVPHWSAMITRENRERTVPLVANPRHHSFGQVSDVHKRTRQHRKRNNPARTYCLLD